MEDTASYQSYMKSPYRSIKHSTYFDAYDKLFGKYRGKPITFVEIGVLGGGSLFMWRDFFGDQARIIGIDLNPGAKKWEKDGFEILIASQSDESFWKTFSAEIGPVDILLDDGGHTFEQQIITTEKTIDLIKDGGVLVVEDTHTSYMDGFGPRAQSFIEYCKTYIDRINYRFSKFQSPVADRRTWSIEIFESIVAFHVDRAKSGLKSAPTENGGKSDFAEDFRHVGSTDARLFDQVTDKVKFAKAIPGVKYFGKLAREYAINRKVKKRIRKYF